MLLSDHYKNYRGPELISAVLGGENITAKATQLYGENNNWHGCLWTYKEAFGDKCENKNYRFDFKGKDGKEHWFHGFITDMNQYFNPPLHTPINQIPMNTSS